MLPMNLATAIHNIHADRLWWRKVLLGGALVMTVFGAPWPAGLVAERMDNVRKGFPTPLPPTIDPWGRVIIGLFALILDFFFFFLPLLGISALFFCVAAGIAVGPAVGISVQSLGMLFGITLIAYVILMFAISIAPVARLRYIEQGSIESALSMLPLRSALDSRRRASYARARLHSLPGYLPLLVLAAAAWASTQVQLPVGWLITGALVWLACSAWVYAHLIVAQLYGDAERHLN